MGLLAHIDYKMLVVGVILGVIATYVIKPEKRVVVKYPEPAKADSLVYKDNNGTCFKFNAQEVSCADNEGKLADFPLQN